MNLMPWRRRLLRAQVVSGQVDLTVVACDGADLDCPASRKSRGIPDDLVPNGGVRTVCEPGPGAGRVRGIRGRGAARLLNLDPHLAQAVVVGGVHDDPRLPAGH